MDVATAFANHRLCRKGAAAQLLISPLAGEMSGRTEGGVKELDIDSRSPTTLLVRPFAKFHSPTRRRIGTIYLLSKPKGLEKTLLCDA
ncbi:hypothetical protein [Mesorhizobium sp.]|uniref:hypothetical protein n=1 Tax=Mesorhizobium sp. TaxID=1871066 RepID=UPI0025E029E1|nr:hypothetical protein [Mesorhizobium sp.]